MKCKYYKINKIHYFIEKKNMVKGVSILLCGIAKLFIFTYTHTHLFILEHDWCFFIKILKSNNLLSSKYNYLFIFNKILICLIYNFYLALAYLMHWCECMYKLVLRFKIYHKLLRISVYLFFIYAVDMH